MPTTVELLDRGPITYESAVQREDNILTQLTYAPETKKLYRSLWESRKSIAAVTAAHLGLRRQDTCTVLGKHTWIRGSFNVCIPVEVIRGNTCKKVLMRCPMPHKLAEAKYAGAVDEKIGCEVGTYAWIQDQCSEVPVPHLFGFGFSDGRHTMTAQFTHALHRSFYIRFVRQLRRFLCAGLRYPVPSHYTRNSIPHSLGHTGYMLLEYIEPKAGEMLSNTWQEHREDPIRKQNLFRGMARLILSLARAPQPRIGSFFFHDDGTVTLTNRPLTCSTIILENEGAPRIMQRSDTYTCTEAFVSDMLTFHDQRFLGQPNAVYDEGDCRSQMAVKTLLRTFSHHNLMREYRYGPYLLQLTDFHPSNIFVDTNWNLTCVIDLEWVCSLPVESLAVPYWLTGRGIGQIQGEHLDDFDKVRLQFMQIFEEEEKMTAKRKRHDIYLTKIMHTMWESKGMWFWHCLESVNGMYQLLEDHICPMFSSDLSTGTERTVSFFWCENSADIVAKKLGDKESYDRQIRKFFDERAEDSVR